tara:strand:- start:34 stop:384 length:351 start_codon:yes stop_codon:yes gene_type:complete
MYQGAFPLLLLATGSVLLAHAQDMPEVATPFLVEAVIPSDTLALPPAPAGDVVVQMADIQQQVVMLEQQVTRQAINHMAICEALGIDGCEEPALNVPWLPGSDATAAVLPVDTASP